MDAHTVSVIIPTKDRPELLLAATRSALAQRDVDVEVIVVDDGSVEPCEPVLAALGEDRLTLVRHEHSRGPAEARNSGIAAARGRWLTFLDDDDLLAPDNLVAHLAALTGEPGARWSCVGLIHIDRRGGVIGSSSPPDHARVAAELSWRNAVPAPSCVLVEAAAVDEAGRFDPAFSCHADWDLWLRLVRCATLASVDRPLAAYRYHEGNLSAQVDLCDLELHALRSKHGLPHTPAGAASQASWGRAQAFDYLRVGHSRRAMKEMWRLGRLERDWRAVLAAAALAVSPAAVERAVRVRSSRRVPEGWRRDAERWLAEYV